MNQTAIVSSKGQVTIPNKVRADFGISKGDLLLFETKKNKITIKKAKGLDIAYLKATQEGLKAEWNSKADNDAYNDL